MSDSMVERVARALCRESGHEGDIVDPDFVLNGVVFWTHWERQARAAIAAMREPTEAMVAVGTSKVLGCFGDERWMGGDAENATGIYRAMIDEAMKEGGT